MNGRCSFGILSMQCTGGMGSVALALAIAFFGCVLYAGYLTIRLDWILLHRHPEIHRDFQLGHLFGFLRNEDTWRRIRDLNDPKLNGLLDRMLRLQLAIVAIFAGLSIGMFLGI